MWCTFSFCGGGYEGKVFNPNHFSSGYYYTCIAYMAIAHVANRYENPQVRKSELGVIYQNYVFRKTLEKCHHMILSECFLDERVHLHIHAVDLPLS